MSDRVTIRLGEERVEICDQLMARSYASDDVPIVDSRSELIRQIFDQGLEALPESRVDLEKGEVDGEALLDLLDDETILEFRRESYKKQSKPLWRGSKLAERFGDKTEELFSGSPDEKATPHTVERLAESYIRELEDHEELSEIGEESVERQKRAIRETVDEYRERFRSAQSAPRELMRPTPEEAQIGAEFERLRASREAFVDDLREKASTDRFTNPDDLMKALGYDYGVSVEAIELLLDEITLDGEPGRQALKNGSGVKVPELVDDVEGELPDVEELDVDRVEEHETETSGGYNDGAVPAGFRIDGDLGDLSDSEIEELIKSGELDPTELLN